MKKLLISWDFLFISLSCLFAGLIDGFSFLYRDATFCLVQTGNLIKSIIFFFQNKVFEGAYALIIVLVFCIFVFVFWFVIRYLKSKKINYNFILLPLIGLLLVPSIIWKFDTSNYLSYKNIISGSCISIIGSIMTLVFKNVKFKFDRKLSFNPTVMTGNIRSLMTTFGIYLKEKDKEKGHEAFCYLSIILAFILGVTITSIFYSFTPSDISFYIILAFAYTLIVGMMIVFHFRFEWIKNTNSN